MTPKAAAFVAANKQSPVVSGYAIEPDPRKPAKGVVYTLDDGRRFRLTVEDGRQVEPRWKL